MLRQASISKILISRDRIGPPLMSLVPFLVKRTIKFPMMFDQHRHAYIKVGENKPETQPMNNTAHTPITNDMEDDIYSAEKDCMAGMTEEQKMEIKKEIRDQSRRTYSIGSAIIGGSFGLVLACMWYFK